MFASLPLLILVICSFSNAASTQSISTNVGHRKRYARAISTPPTIEVLVVADESMVKFHGNGSVRQYVLTIMAKVRLGGGSYVADTMVSTCSTQIPAFYSCNMYMRFFVRFSKPDFHTVVKIESRSFSSAEIQHFRTENTRSDSN
jgi:hypothetical protein